MDIQFNDREEKLDYFCNRCHRGIEHPHDYKFCPYCRHEYDVEKVNKIRQKIAKIIFNEG